jgi:hypothetical protein
MTPGPVSGKAAEFAAAARRFQVALGPLLRFLWLEDAAAEPSDWPRRAVLVEQEAGAAAGTVAAPADFAFGDYRLTIAAGQAIAPGSEGFSVSGGDGWAFSLRSATSAWALTAPTGSSGVISFASDSAGCIQLDLSLPQDHEGTGIDDYTRLDVGFRFAIDEPSPLLEGQLRSLRYPLFEAVPGAGVKLSCRFDPALPLDAKRTRLAYATATPAHASGYRGTLGHEVALTPSAGGSLPAGLAFQRRPSSLFQPPAEDGLYLGPIGQFTATIAAGGSGGTAIAPAARLSCGLAGTEYFGLSAATGATISFTPGGAAYADGSSLAPRATASWSAVTPSAQQQAWYYAQPEAGSLHRLRPSGSALLPYLVYLELPAGSLADPQQAAYPFLPYAFVSAADLAPYQELEAQVLAPQRRQALAPSPLSPTTAQTLPAVTPQGLLAQFTTDLASWKQLSLVPLPTGVEPDPPSLAFNDLGDEMRQALQASELFVVAADGELLPAAADLNYWLTDAAISDLEELPAGERPPDAVMKKLKSAAARKPQVGKAAFAQMLERVLASAEERGWIPKVTELAAYFEIAIAGWRFRLSPLLWQRAKAQSGAPPLMVFKFAGSKLSSLAADPASWTWPAVAGDREATGVRLREIIRQAREQVDQARGSAHPLDFFVETVCEDPAWTGVLFFDAPVPFSSMPEELRGLAAGIDKSKFRAHHVGLSISPVEVDTGTGAISLASSSFFGLIDYESPEDIAHTFEDFDFKVLQLQILFRNSAVADFASRVELFVNRLFGEEVELLESEHYNNVILAGSYQRQASGGRYVFATAGTGVFASKSAVLEGVEVTRAQFDTAPIGAGRKVRSQFLVWGRLRFRQLQGFDLFSFGHGVDEEDRPGKDGYLAFSGLAVAMEFAESEPEGKKLRLDVEGVSFDPGASRPRPAGFAARFPLTVAGMVTAGKGRTPKDLGYEPVETPLAQPALADGWYAIAFTVDLGTLGALAAEAGLVVTLLAAWGPSAGEPAVNVGLRLPGSQSLKSLPAIEGVLQLGFQSISLDAHGAADAPPAPAYVLRLRHFSLQLLSWRFPPGQADVYLFGDPEAGPTQRGALGWYSAYLKEGE